MVPSDAGDRYDPDAREHSQAPPARHIPKAVSPPAPMKPRASVPIARSNLLLAQWSRSMGELVAACNGPGFEEALCRALRRLVEVDFAMVLAIAARSGRWRSAIPWTRICSAS